MPKRGEKNVLASGICTWPPSASALNSGRPRPRPWRETESEKPSNSGLPWARPSEAMICVSPMRKAGVHDLVLGAGRALVGCGSGLSLKRIIMSTLAPSAFL